MKPPTVISSHAEMLLTSVGPTTEPLQEHLLELGRAVSKLASLQVMVVTDGWVPFKPDDGVGVAKRLEQRTDNRIARWWTGKYLNHVLSKANVMHVRVEELNDEQLAATIDRAGMILLPGSNTYQMMRGLHKHRYAMREAVENGVPLVGDSAGSIVAGLTTHSAALKPADTRPQQIDVDIDTGLALIGANVITHAPGRNEGFDLPRTRLACMVLHGYETPSPDISRFVTSQTEAGIYTYSLSDNQGLRVSRGVIQYIS